MAGDKKYKIAFIWYWDRASEIKPNWRDGLRSALEIIEKKHTTDKIAKIRGLQSKYGLLNVFHNSDDKKYFKKLWVLLPF